MHVIRGPHRPLLPLPTGASPRGGPLGVAAVPARQRPAQPTRLAARRNDEGDGPSLEHLAARYAETQKDRGAALSKLDAERALHAQHAEIRRLAMPGAVSAAGLGLLALAAREVAAATGSESPWAILAVVAGFFAEQAVDAGPPRLPPDPVLRRRALAGSALLTALTLPGGGAAAAVAGLALGAGLSRAILAAFRFAERAPSAEQLTQLERAFLVSEWEEGIAKAELEEHPAYENRSFLERCLAAPPSDPKPPTRSP